MVFPVGHTTISATAAIKTSGGSLSSVILTGGADAATVTLHDNASAGSGVVMCVVKAAINTTTVVDFAHPLAFSNGLYATVTGTTPDVTVGYF